MSEEKQMALEAFDRLIRDDFYFVPYEADLFIREYHKAIRTALQESQASTTAAGVELQGDYDLMSESMSLSRQHLKEVGIFHAFFDDSVLMACQEIIRLREQVAALQESQSIPAADLKAVKNALRASQLILEMCAQTLTTAALGLDKLSDDQREGCIKRLLPVARLNKEALALLEKSE